MPGDREGRPYYIVTHKTLLSTSSDIRLVGDAGCHLPLEGKAWIRAIPGFPSRGSCRVSD